MEYLWSILISALAILLAFIADSYIGLSTVFAKKSA